MENLTHLMTIKLGEGSITCYECGKPGHIKWKCPNLKITREKKEENAEVKKERRGKKQRAFWLNFNSESSSDDEKKEIVNLCLMAGSSFSDSEKDEVCSPTYEELNSYVDELFDSLKMLKKKYTSLKKNHTALETSKLELESENGKLVENIKRLEKTYGKRSLEDDRSSRFLTDLVHWKWLPMNNHDGLYRSQA